MADSSRHSLFTSLETVYGVTNATPSFDEIRHTGTTLALTKTSSVSDELRGDRQISDATHGVRQVAGDISGELSYGTYDELIEAALGGSWTADVLKAGVTRRSFTVMRNFEDILVADKPIYLYTGSELNTLQMTMSPDARAVLTLGLIGRNLETPAGTAPAGSTLVAPTTSQAFNGFGGSINEGGSPIAIATELQFTLGNGIEPRFVIGDDKTIRPQIGRSNISGQIVAYFENADLVNKFLGETASSLDFTVSDAAGNSYLIEFPNILYNGASPDTQGQGAITLTMPFQALYDSTEGTNIKITRTPA
tara:strand:- start:393 stop:1313 length:921 start_codon:yes stop_codon:yes gene_type:complete